MNKGVPKVRNNVSFYRTTPVRCERPLRQAQDRLRERRIPRVLSQKAACRFCPWRRRFLEGFTRQAHPQFLEDLLRLRGESAFRVILPSRLDQKRNMPHGICLTLVNDLILIPVMAQAATAGVHRRILITYAPQFSPLLLIYPFLLWMNLYSLQTQHDQFAQQHIL